MISESEALDRILRCVPDAGRIAALLGDSLGSFAVEEVLATVPMPGFDNSSMDGYAVRAADCASTGAKLRVAGTQPAGRDLGLELKAGEAIRIFTGAPIPHGADAVVMQEEVEIDPGDGKHVTIATVVKVGEFIRRRGADLCEGQTVLRAGDMLSPGRIGLLASQGIGTVSVGTKPRVCVMTTGDELVSPPASLQPGQIFNSNGWMFEAMARECGMDDVSRRHVMDDITGTESAISEEITKGGAIIISGGVSVGERDFVKEALARNGVDPEFWRVRVKPGKPLLFGATGHDQSGKPTLIFGLPGNPVSSFVTFCLFVRPALLKWSGAASTFWHLRSSVCLAGQSFENPGDRPHYLRGFVQAEPESSSAVFQAAALQESHGLQSLASSNALLRLDAGEKIERGATIRVLMASCAP